MTCSVLDMQVALPNYNRDGTRAAFFGFPANVL